jgi:hypothetical protein
VRGPNMGVVLTKDKKSGYLECDRDGCDSKSKSYKPASPAAPALTICEAAHNAEGWAFDVGFFCHDSRSHRLLSDVCRPENGGPAVKPPPTDFIS